MNYKHTLHILTSRSCNNNCIFCLDDRPKRKWVSLEEVKSQLKEYKSSGEVLFTCGEPTIHPDFLRMVSMAKKAGYKVIGVVSNGRAFSNINFTLKALKAGLNWFMISIHGPDAKIHDRITRSPGSFKQTKEGIKHLIGSKLYFKNIRLQLVTVVCKWNMQHLISTVEQFFNMGVDFYALNFIQPDNNALSHFNNIVPSISDAAYWIRETIIRTGLSPELIQVNGLPYCLMKGLEEYVSINEVIHVDIMGQLVTLDIHRSKTKHKRCQLCTFNERCGGVFKNYVSNRGWSEIPLP